MINRLLKLELDKIRMLKGLNARQKLLNKRLTSFRASRFSDIEERLDEVEKSGGELPPEVLDAIHIMVLDIASNLNDTQDMLNHLACHSDYQ